jgi:hypothetical protein
VLAPQLGIVFKDFHQIVVITLQFLWHGLPLPVRAKKECGFLCLGFRFSPPQSPTALTILINYILWINREILE